MKHQSSQKAFSILIAVGLSLFLSLMGLYLMEYIIPFSRNVKGIESASNSFYQAYSGLEQSLYLQSQNTPGYQTGVSLQSSVPEQFAYTIIGNGRFSPRQGVQEGNSEYDKNYNKLSQVEPAQFLIGNGRLNGATGSLQLSLKVPDINPSTADQLTNTGSVVLWQLSSSGSTLTAGSLISGTQVNSVFTGQLLQATRTGVLLNGSVSNFRNFYDTNCETSGEECVLKVSLIAPLISTLSGNPRVPYLEYRLRADPNIPLRDATIIVQGKSYGFSKILQVGVPQTTTNSAFDFTVFQ